ncbi:DUF397 domain-containing protein [Streptomyces sp. NBC_01006]|uniref:DUF397 domain-containing protein n=1 Tax=Streptomyces sp. NBC_01006 TaxID=2903716 RepID=UPI00386E9691|nr:DUF397 domain-containing protein [Streptomyces sp. NBC_01006]
MTSTDTNRPYGQWFKSSYSGDASGNCLEACPQPGAVHVRDSKRLDDAQAPVLDFSNAAWAAFAGHVGSCH